jgi:hypothetical protein
VPRVLAASREPALRQPATHRPQPCARSITECPPLIPDAAESCDAAAQWCIIMWELVVEDIASTPLAVPHMLTGAGTIVPPSSRNAACNSPCPPASNATARAGLVGTPANGATRATVSTNNGTSTEMPGITPPAAAWPASPLANSTDGSVSTRTWRSTASLVMSPSQSPNVLQSTGDENHQHSFWLDLETTCGGVQREVLSWLGRECRSNSEDDLAAGRAVRQVLDRARGGSLRST